MHDKDGLIEYLDGKLTTAIGYRQQLGVEKSLRKSDDIMYGDRNHCSERDMNQNFLRRKVFSLYTLLSNQLESQRTKAVGIEITEQDDAPKELYESVADEVIEELMFSKSTNPDSHSIGVRPFLQTIQAHYDIRSQRMTKEIQDALAKVEPELRKIMFSGENKEEMRKALRDYVMYPTCFVFGVYDNKSYDTDFVRGRVVQSNRPKCTFRTISPWRVYDMPSRRSVGRGGDYFVIEDFSIESLYALSDKDPMIQESINTVIADMEAGKTDCHCSWFSKKLHTIGDGKDEYTYFKDDKTVARGVLYDGIIPNKFLEADGKGYSFGQIWYIDKNIIFLKDNGEQRIPMLMSASFRPGRTATWGISTIDLCYNIQKTIDFVGQKIVGNIEKTSDFQGILDTDIAKSMLKDKKGGDGKLNIDITGVNVAKLIPNKAPFYRFQIANTQQSGILLINELKKHIAELLSLPDFADGSTNVGTVGRTSGGLFLLQRNLAEGIELVRKEFAYNIIVPIGRAVLEKLKDAGRLSKIILNYDVVVREYGLEEERSENADETLKKVQAISQLQQFLQTSGVSVQDNAVLRNLHDSIIKDLAPDYYAEQGGDLQEQQVQPQVDPQVQQQVPQEFPPQSV